MGKLDGRVSIVTGAGSGIGRAIALLFASEGSRVVVVDVNDRGGEETVGMIRNNGGDAFFIHADVSRESDCSSAVKETINHYGQLDILVNNAGIDLPRAKPSADFTIEEFDRVINVNLKGAWLMSKYAIPEMLRQGRGVIINVASVAGLKPLPYAMPYSVSKAGLIMLTEVMAVEYGSRGIRVNAVAPGWVSTPMAVRAASAYGTTYEDFTKLFLQRITLGRFADPMEIARVVLFLASDDSSYMNGSVVVVDGSITLT
ncbi:glucose 1-dehydrogenase [Vulcanisaeta distributa]|uniref:SDR family NAD(P)-dependent oxidoreductase n=1 Tax=Vulcanisaeta distributa TaxID=164451 RepID=UPI0006D1CFDB|nr:glucose 1-dehydrogenase [Vulcanisaeta distributa]